jgi:ankyrin repeat protein
VNSTSDVSIACSVEKTVAEIVFEVCHKSTLRTERLGSVRIPVASLQDGEVNERWWPLSSKKVKDKEKGSLRVGVLRSVYKDLEAVTPVFKAVKSADVATLATLLASGTLTARELNVRDRVGNTPLHAAASLGNDALLHLLLASPLVQVNVTNSDLNTPLHYFCLKARDPDTCVETLNLFLSRGADLYAVNKHGSTVLHTAALNASVRLLLLEWFATQLRLTESTTQSRIDFTSQNNAGDTPLTIALRYKPSLPLIRFLLVHGANPEEIDCFFASSNDDTEPVLSDNAAVSRSSPQSPLHTPPHSPPRATFLPVSSTTASSPPHSPPRSSSRVTHAPILSTSPPRVTLSLAPTPNVSTSPSLSPSISASNVTSAMRPAFSDSKVTLTRSVPTLNSGTATANVSSGSKVTSCSSMTAVQNSNVSTLPMRSVGEQIAESLTKITSGRDECDSSHTTARGASPRQKEALKVRALPSHLRPSASARTRSRSYDPQPGTDMSESTALQNSLAEFPTHEHSTTTPTTVTAYRSAANMAAKDKDKVWLGSRSPSHSHIPSPLQQFQAMDNSLKAWLKKAHDLWTWLCKINFATYFRYFLAEEMFLDLLPDITEPSIFTRLHVPECDHATLFMHCKALQTSQRSTVSPSANETGKRKRSGSLAAFRSFLQAHRDFLISEQELEYVGLIGTGLTSKVYKAVYRPANRSKNLTTATVASPSSTESPHLRSVMVAVKVIKNRVLNTESDSNELENIKKEFKVLSQVSSPHVVHMYGVCLDPKLSIVMEYCERGSLLSVLKDTSFSLSWNLVLRFALGTVSGLEALHTQTPVILHRDLKSLNLLVDRDWNIKVTDFGTSKLGVLTGETRDEDKQVLGTLEYCAPEVFDGAAYSVKSDIYSVGIVLWEIVSRKLTGVWQSPFSNGMEVFPLSDEKRDPVATTNGKLTMAELIIAVKSRHMRPSLPPSCPADWASLIRSCWHPDPTCRPTATELKSRLLDLESQLATKCTLWDSTS